MAQRTMLFLTPGHNAFIYIQMKWLTTQLTFYWQTKSEQWEKMNIPESWSYRITFGQSVTKWDVTSIRNQGQRHSFVEQASRKTTNATASWSHATIVWFQSVSFTNPPDQNKNWTQMFERLRELVHLIYCNTECNNIASLQRMYQIREEQEILEQIEDIVHSDTADPRKEHRLIDRHHTTRSNLFSCFFRLLRHRPR